LNRLAASIMRPAVLMSCRARHPHQIWRRRHDRRVPLPSIPPSASPERLAVEGRAGGRRGAMASRLWGISAHLLSGCDPSMVPSARRVASAEPARVSTVAVAAATGTPCNRWAYCSQRSRA
jgi:hypothetical protein